MPRAHGDGNEASSTPPSSHIPLSRDASTTGSPATLMPILPTALLCISVHVSYPSPGSLYISNTCLRTRMSLYFVECSYRGGHLCMCSNSRVRTTPTSPSKPRKHSRNSVPVNHFPSSVMLIYPAPRGHYILCWTGAILRMTCAGAGMHHSKRNRVPQI